MRLLVVGAAGLLGQKLVERAVEAGHEVVPVDAVTSIETAAGPVGQIDITDADGVSALIAESGPGWILNAAAYTAVDASEEDESKVRGVNVEGVRHLLASASEHGARLLALSTDYVFDGRDGPYSENAPRNPLGTYGASKAEMEDVVIEDGGPHIIARTMVLYGAAPGVRPNFGLWVLRNLRAGNEIRAVTDQMGNPTLASDLARMLLTMVESGGSGLYHVAGADRVSRYEFAVALARRFGLDESNITPVTTGELGQAADRPLESGFVLDRLKKDFNLEPLGLVESLARFSEEVELHGDGI